MNLLVFSSELTDHDKDIIWFWMIRENEQFHGEIMHAADYQQILFYDREKVLARARAYLDLYSDNARFRWEGSSTYETYLKLLTLIKEDTRCSGNLK